ncbi:MAG: hemolysin D, partial [Gammaproteobacteria bacterium]
MKKKVIAIVILLLLITGGVTVFKQQQSTQLDNELTLYGNIDIREVQLTVNASEHITHIYVQEGDRVKKGQLLARLQT